MHSDHARAQGTPGVSAESKKEILDFHPVFPCSTALASGSRICVRGSAARPWTHFFRDRSFGSAILTTTSASASSRSGAIMIGRGNARMGLGTRKGKQGRHDVLLLNEKFSGNASRCSVSDGNKKAR